MKGILIQQKVFKAIDGKYADNVSDDKKLENDEYAYSSIILNLSDSVIRKVGKQDSAKDLWNKLEELYTETSLPSKLFLLEKFFRYKLDLSKNIDENIDDFTKLIQDIKLTGDKNIDDYSPIVLLNAIPETYGDVKAAIKGHFIKECKKPKKNEPKDTANVAEESSDEVYMLCDVNSAKSSLNMNEWLLDSGCTFHMTPFKEILTNYKSDNSGSVSMANEKLCDVKGFGDVCLTFESGFKLTLKNVRHVPDLCHNLISCAALEEEGLEGRWVGKVPEHVWSGKNVDLSSLRVFGCSAFVFQNNDKLEPRAQKCVFIGYPEGVKGYRLWLRNQTGFKVVISKDVTFNEYEMPCLNNSSKTDLDLRSMFNKVEGSKEDNQQGEEDSEETQPESENTRIETQNDISSENISITHDYQLARDRDRRESRIILALTAQFDWELKQMDVKTAFLHGLPHWEALKWLLRYLNGSVSAGIKFSKDADGVSLVGYVDSNYANDRDSRRYHFSSIQLCKNPVFHDRTKHIDVRYHFIRDIVGKEIINLEKINSDNNPADMGSITLGPVSFGNDEAHFRPLGFGPRWNMLKYWPKSSLAQKPSSLDGGLSDLSPLGYPHHQPDPLPGSVSLSYFKP
ncbi:Retrovirus-related Pol polyprotein from transposon TNT 1-94 [Sesamum angolense]|uniref:Retrovirus-related Pol polyprotein from transposon TNT 1-94 n=1 Tax=Sesamum angolense TaxID=2727404 RepID=A0AAE2C3S9_9LAMI|nr:Retrovirus-related Pol polyprotein from transposon TNT 1-94 [Sesamum angolense]